MNLTKSSPFCNDSSLKILAIFTVIVILFGCKKDKGYSDIPYVNVQLYIPLSLPQYSALNGIGNSMVVAGGYRGIIIYRRDISEFVAFEQACTFDPTAPNALVEIDSSGVMGVDHNCGSKFNLLDYGSIMNGPATRPLKQYRTEYDSGTLTLYIHN